MQTIRQLLDEKGHEVACVKADALVYDAIKQMADREIGSLVVLEDERIAGIITERHYARNVILKGKSSLETQVREIMASPVVCARPDQTVEQCMAIMTEKRLRHLPVVEATQLLGMVSIGDLVKATIADREFTIDQLVNYIHG